MTELRMPASDFSIDPELGVSPTLAALGEYPSQAQLADFWLRLGSRSPLIEADRAGHACVTFIWRGAAAPGVFVSVNRVTLTLEHAALQQVPGTDLWYRSFILPHEWRGSYTLLVPNAAQLDRITQAEPRWAMRIIREEGQCDPRNPRQIRTHTGMFSEVALSGAPGSALLRTPPPGSEVHTTELLTPTGRQAWLITPGSRTSNESRTEPRPLIIMLDGAAWQQNGSVARVCANLSASVHRATAVPGRTSLAPAVLLIAASVEHRMTDYGPESEIPAELVHTVLPWIRTLIPVSERPSDITLCGESLGGLTALRTAFAYPDHIGRVIAQSSSLWAADLTLSVPASAQPLRVHLTVGTQETRMLSETRELNTALRDAGHDVHYTEFCGGHDMAWWVQLWAEAVRTFAA